VQYPTLSKMARDYLAIQGSATPSERAFSSGGTTGTAKRNRLKPDAFEALQLLKSAYRNGHLAADKEAHEHSLSIRDLFDSDDDEPVDPRWKGKGRAVDDMVSMLD
jgi:hAT family C-terminal dimerisation region